jgi:hypothetical protein
LVRLISGCIWLAVGTFNVAFVHMCITNCVYKLTWDQATYCSMVQKKKV